MTCKDIIVQYLKDNGYDGLAGDGCGCALKDLGPCECYISDCMPAWWHESADCGCPEHEGAHYCVKPRSRA